MLAPAATLTVLELLIATCGDSVPALTVTVPPLVSVLIEALPTPALVSPCVADSVFEIARFKSGSAAPLPTVNVRVPVQFKAPEIVAVDDVALVVTSAPRVNVPVPVVTEPAVIV